MEFGGKLDLGNAATQETALKVLRTAIRHGKSDRRICLLLNISQDTLDSLKAEISYPALPDPAGQPA